MYVIMIHVSNVLSKKKHFMKSSYLNDSVKVASKNNNVILIGDDSNKYLEKIDNVTHINVNELNKKDNILNFRKHFVNFSNYEYEFAYICFIRVFLIYN